MSSLSLKRPAEAAAAAALRWLRWKRHFANAGLQGGGDLLAQAYHLAREQASFKNKARLVRPGSSSAPR